MSKDKDNIIPFPGTKLPTKDSIDKLNDELLMQKEEVEMIESTIDEVAIDLIRRLVDMGIDINKKEFYGDLAMITELVRGLIYRDFKREHNNERVLRFNYYYICKRKHGAEDYLYIIKKYNKQKS